MIYHLYEAVELQKFYIETPKVVHYATEEPRRRHRRWLGGLHKRLQ